MTQPLIKWNLKSAHGSSQKQEIVSKLYMSALNEQLDMRVAVLIGSKELRRQAVLEWKT